MIERLEKRDDAKSYGHKSGPQEALVGDTDSGCVASCWSAWSRLDRGADCVGSLFTDTEEASNY
jgi:hypothetical protein